MKKFIEYETPELVVLIFENCYVTTGLYASGTGTGLDPGTGLEPGENEEIDYGNGLK